MSVTQLKVAKEKMANREGLDMADLQALVPAAFTKDMSIDVRKNLNITDKYVHIPTSEVIEDLMKLNWTPIEASQVKSRKKKAGYQKHMITFVNYDLIDESKDEHPQLLLINSHDGLSSFRFEIGVFRLVCSNGLIIKSADYGGMHIRHLWYDFETLKDTINQMVEKVPEFLVQVDKMKAKELEKEQIEEFARKAAMLRFKDSNEVIIDKIIDLDELIQSTRNEDSDNTLWNIFNRVQEKLINGKFEYTMGNKMRKARALNSLNARLKVNQDLWEMASEMV